jgi:alkanesulfonate monooxygenase
MATSNLEIYSYLSPAANGAQLVDIESTVNRIGALDEALIGYHSFGPDGIVLGSATAALNRDIRVLIAHRPGVMQPTVAARIFGTLSRISDGRLDVNVVSGGAPGDQFREGDFLGHDDRYRRAAEYVDVMRKFWAATEPFSHEGEFYRFEDVRPNELAPGGPIRIHMGGASRAGLEFGASKADVYMLWGEPLAEIRERIEVIEKKAAEHGRPRPRISLSLRLYTGETEEKAWELAKSEPVYQKWLARGGAVSDREHGEDAGRNRQLTLAREGEVHDDCFWTGIVAAMNGLGNSSALVGTEERILAALREYRDIGVDTFLVTGEGGDWRPSLAPTVERMRRELGS